MSASSPTRIRAGDLTGRRRLPFDLRPDPAPLLASLGLIGLTDLRFAGELRPQGRADVVLAGRLQARAVQECVATLAPVVTAIDVPVERIYLADMAWPDAPETEMPEDDRREPMPAEIDLIAVLAEALALELPDYPRSPAAGDAGLVVGPPGVAPLDDASLRPFAALAALRRDGTGGDGAGGE